MPGLNKQGPEGKGPLTGRQQGMCRRTDELPLRGGGDGLGRGMGGRRRGSYFQGPKGQGAANVRSNDLFPQGNAEELASLKAEYKKTQSMLATLMQKIKGMEGVKEASESNMTDNDG